MGGMREVQSLLQEKAGFCAVKEGQYTGIWEKRDLKAVSVQFSYALTDGPSPKGKRVSFVDDSLDSDADSLVLSSFSSIISLQKFENSPPFYSIPAAAV